MKVISGSARGIPLQVAKPRFGEPPRPITDRIKESLFSILLPILPGAEVLDLFSGSGAIGIEAISRGAEKAVFVEQNRDCCEIIKRNIERTKMGNCAEIMRCDALYAVKQLSSLGRQFDIIFADPPFPMTEDETQAGYFVDIWNTFESSLLKDDGLAILRCEEKKAVVPNELLRLSALPKTDERDYGRSVIYFFSKSRTEGNAENAD